MKRKGMLAAFILGLVFGMALGPCTFAYMAPMLAVTFKVAATNLLYGILLLAALRHRALLRHRAGGHVHGTGPALPELERDIQGRGDPEEDLRRPRPARRHLADLHRAVRTSLRQFLALWDVLAFCPVDPASAAADQDDSTRILRLTVDAESQAFRAKALVKAQAAPNRVLSRERPLLRTINCSKSSSMFRLPLLYDSISSSKVCWKSARVLFRRISFSN